MATGHQLNILSVMSRAQTSWVVYIVSVISRLGLHCIESIIYGASFNSKRKKIIQFDLLLSPYLCFISLLFFDLHVLGTDALIS